MLSDLLLFRTLYKVLKPSDNSGCLQVELLHKFRDGLCGVTQINNFYVAFSNRTTSRALTHITIAPNNIVISFKACIIITSLPCVGQFLQVFTKS
jgi:hypothetical protein